MIDAPTTCIGMVRRQGIDRYCGQSVGVTRWTDHTGKARAACPNHLGGMKRRYPPDLPERTAPEGTLWTHSPWTRGAFAPDDRIRIENAMPEGYRINVIAENPRRFVLVALRASEDPSQHAVELFRTTSTSDPVRTAEGVIERLRLMEAER